MKIKHVVVRHNDYGTKSSVSIHRLDGVHTYKIRSANEAARLNDALGNTGAIVSFVNIFDRGVSVGFNIP